MARTATTEMLPIWRSEAQPAVLYAALYLPGATASSISARFDLTRQQVGTEIHRLERAGIIKLTRIGRNAVVSINANHPAVGGLRPLVDLTIGPFVDLSTLYNHEGVVVVYVFGSWARRHLGEPGPPPQDLDVLVVGTAGRYDIEDACLAISGRHGIDVNPITVTAHEFEHPDTDSILASIVQGVLVEVRR